jgi:hypothetical protein
MEVIPSHNSSPSIAAGERRPFVVDREMPDQIKAVDSVIRRFTASSTKLKSSRGRTFAGIPLNAIREG